MDLPPVLLQFVGSLIAIFVLAALVWKLGLGAAPKLTSEADVLRAADEIVSGFEPVEIALDREGTGALAQDAAGRILMIRRHGSHFAGRELGSEAEGKILDGKLHVSTMQTQFGSAAFEVPNAAHWVSAIERIGQRANA